MINLHFTWSTDWIQEYESPWGILEKFKYANAIDSNTVLELIGNDDVKQLKNVSNAGSSHRNLIELRSIDSKLTEKIIGINLIEYNNNLIDKLVHIIPNIGFVNDYFRGKLSYCPECLNEGYHSIFHQIRFFNYCAFHPDQKLLDQCVQCNKAILDYLIKDITEAYHCNCGYCFLDLGNVKSIFTSWKTKLTVQNKTIRSWLELNKHTINKYHFIYPFDNYNKYFKLDKNNKDYLIQLPKLLIAAFNEGQDNRDITKISSKKSIFKIKNDYQLLKIKYREVFSYRFIDFEFKEKDMNDCIFFEIYKQTRVIYKSMTRYILRKIIKEHSKCIKVFNKANQHGNGCPHALAFILWKMECEGKNVFWEIESHKKVSKAYDFECLKEKFSTFLHGSFITHLDQILNPIIRDREFDLLNWNISSINYIVNRITSHLLIERYIKWLEVVQHPEKFDWKYPNDTIPMYLAKIPLDLNEEISFYFPKCRIQYMKDIIEDIENWKSCPFKKKSVPFIKTFNQIALIHE